VRRGVCSPGRVGLTAAVLLAAASVLTRASLAETAAPPADGETVTDHLIDLPAALRLAGAQNLDVQAARARLAEARALHQDALLRFFPWVIVGISYTRHDGRLQATEGDVVTVSRQAYAPGATLTGQWELGDAVYRRLAAKQLEHAAGHALDAQRQDAVVAAARDYFDLAVAQAAVGVAREAVQISTSHESQVRAAVEAGIAFKGDALRVAVQTERNRLLLRQGEERQRVAAARLAQTLHLDPAIRLVARDADLVPLALVATPGEANTLVQQALLARPELKRSRALVEAAREDAKAAVYGPLIPSLGAQVFGGGMGGGRNDATGSFGDREDYLVGVGWRIGPGGIFDFPRQRAARARLSSAEIGAQQTHDEIVREVVEASTRMQSQLEQIDVAKRALGSAEEALRLVRQRREFGVGIVLENILAERDFTQARNDYLHAVAELNKAQYELSKAVGGLAAAP
jgi:outer membrane protein TolC